VIPDHYDKTLHLLVVWQRYNMAKVQLSVHAEMKSKDIPLLIVATFGTYNFAGAKAKGLTQKTESAARLTLGFPMTIEPIRERR